MRKYIRFVIFVGIPEYNTSFVYIFREIVVKYIQ